MKAVILAGGMGTRIAEESHLRPKPMIEIGGRPILWHVMNIYTSYGVTDFVICLGYRGYVIKEYFAKYIPSCPWPCMAIWELLLFNRLGAHSYASLSLRHHGSGCKIG